MAQDASGNTIVLPFVTNSGASVAVADESAENDVPNAFPPYVEPPPADNEVQAAVVNALDMAEVQLFGASAGAAATIADGVYLVKALHSGKCMEVAGASTANGSNVQQWSCNPTARHHQWQFTAVGNGYYKITNVNSGKVLDVAWGSTADEANILQWDYLDGSNQKWKPVLQSDGSYQLVAAHSNKCADVWGISTADGANLAQHGCHTGTNQRFTLTPVTNVPDGVYLVKAVHSGKCMEVAGAGTANGSNVQQWSCVPNAKHHQWQFTAVGNGYYKITNVNSGKVLDVAWGSTADEANILQWDYLDGSNQKWQLVAQSDGSYQLVAAHSNKCADVSGPSTADGATIIQYGCHTGTNQRFTLTPVAAAQATTGIPEGSYLLKAVHSGKCMEVAGAGTANGSNVQQWSCNPTARHHQWQFTAVGNGYYKITNVNSGKVLDVAGISTADGANLHQWDYLNGNNQKWKPVLQSDGSYQLVAAHSNKCADVWAAVTDGVNIAQFGCHTGANQRFRLLPAGIESLKGVPIPEDANINNYVVNRQAAKALGKALFWDMAVSSDGQTACASCHFHAGADPRTKNQLNPGLLHLAGAPTNSTYNPTRSGNAGGVNYRMTAADFPTFVLADPHNRDSQILFQSDDVVSSQGSTPNAMSTRPPATPVTNVRWCLTTASIWGGSQPAASSRAIRQPPSMPSSTCATSGMAAPAKPSMVSTPLARAIQMPASINLMVSG